MHTPNPGEIEPDVRDPEQDTPQPPVPPDQRPDVIPQRDPPNPGRREDNPPMIVGHGSTRGR